MPIKRMVQFNRYKKNLKNYLIGDGALKHALSFLDGSTFLEGNVAE